MKLRDWTEIAAWAGISTVIGLAAFGGRTAVSDGVRPAPQLPAAAIGACRVTAHAAPIHGLGSANIKLSIANPGARSQNVTFDVDVVANRFTGNPLSRTPSAVDVQETIVEHRRISRTVAPASVMPVTYVVPAAAFQPKVASAKQAILSSTRRGTFSSPATMLSFAALPNASRPAASLPAVYEVRVKVDGKLTLLTNFNMQGA